MPASTVGILADEIERLVIVVPTEPIQKRKPAGHADRQLRTELRVAARLAALDRPHVRLRKTDDAIVDAMRFRFVHLQLLPIDLAADQQVFALPTAQL